jgi:hypothetical protein
LGAPPVVTRKGISMTLNMMSIDVEEPDDPQSARNTNTIDQFWTAASDVLIEIVKRQHKKMIDPVADAGGTLRLPRTIKPEGSR